MHKYLLAFYKKGNMRFISHLDLQRLFKRCIKRAGIRPAYTAGFNPHEKVNIVHPLPLGFESLRDYFEIESEESYGAEFLIEELNKALPSGIAFDFCREILWQPRNLSSKVGWSEYFILLPMLPSQELRINEFIMQEEVKILKRDKKSKALVEMDVKSWIYSLTQEEKLPGACSIKAVLRSASNRTLNPANLTEALCLYSGFEVDREIVRITRLDMYIEGEEGLVPLSAVEQVNL